MAWFLAVTADETLNAKMKSLEPFSWAQDGFICMKKRRINYRESTIRNLVGERIVITVWSITRQYKQDDSWIAKRSPIDVWDETVVFED